jgi:hypothetical protein
MPTLSVVPGAGPSPLERLARDFPSASTGRPGGSAIAPDLASSLNNLSNSVPGLGRREPAPEGIEEAIAIRHALAERYPAAFAEALAQSIACRPRTASHPPWFSSNRRVRHAPHPDFDPQLPLISQESQLSHALLTSADALREMSELLPYWLIPQASGELPVSPGPSCPDKPESPATAPRCAATPLRARPRSATRPRPGACDDRPRSRCGRGSWPC